MQDRDPVMQPVAEEPEIPRMTPAVQWLMTLNVAVFFLQFTLF